MVAWLFPGQGAQQVGMGKSLFEGSPAAREVFERADAALGWSITKVCFDGPPEELTRTANTQPALVTVSLAALAALREALPDLPEPRLVAGHSLGEYSALVAAGVLTLEDAVRLVHLRGKAMQEAVPEGQGAMAAIMASAEDVIALCKDAAQDDVLAPANFNAPSQIVVAGHAAAVRRAVDLAEQRKVRAMVLNVSAPFHCSLMAPAAAAMKQALEKVELATPRMPVVTNVEATPNTDPKRVVELLVRQVDGPVRWDQSIRFMATSGIERAIEIGPGRVLATLVRRIDKRVKVLSVGDLVGLQKVGEFLA